MKRAVMDARFSRGIRHLGVVLAGTFGVASSASCGSGPSPLVILGVLSPPAPSGSGSSLCCLYTPAVKGPFLSSGTVDFAFTRQYAPELLVANQLVPAPDDSCSYERVDSIVLILGSTVRITDADGTDLDTYTLSGDGFVEDSIVGPGPGLTAYGTTLVSTTVADKLGAFSGKRRLTAHVKVFGVTECAAQGYSSGSHVESDEVSFPIDACVGCLVTYPAAADDPTSATQPNCDATSSSTITPPCVVGQDQPIDCRSCVNTNAPFAPPNVNVCEP